MEATSTPKSKRATKAPNNRELNLAKADLIDRFLAEHASDGADLFGPEGAFTKLKGAVMERLPATRPRTGCACCTSCRT